MKSIIQKPGYHLHPKYDLEKLREVRAKGSKRTTGAELNLTSMIDMFTIIVIFLLMNFSATGEIFFIQKNIKLPAALNTKPIESAPLITVTADSVTLDAEKVGENPVTLTESDANLPRLAAALKQIRNFQETIHPGEPFNGQVNIQADEKTPLVYIKRVMQTCILEGWTGINFVTRQPDETSKENQ